MTTEFVTTVGLDLSDRFSQYCVADSQTGDFLEEGKVATRAEQLRRLFAGAPSSRVVIETGGNSA